MTPVSAALLFEAWEPRSRRPPHQRLAALLAAGAGAQGLADDTLGERNRRLLALHAELVGTRLEARLVCATCHAQNEFSVPTDAVLASAPPHPQATVSLERASGPLWFRLPRMVDLDASPWPAGILARCCLSGEPPALSEPELDELARRFEAFDPAADVVVDLACAGCRRPLRATVDVATFVACELDGLVEALTRDVDRLARAYGWSEEAILALPPARRRRYLSLIAARGVTPARRLERPA